MEEWFLWTDFIKKIKSGKSFFSNSGTSLPKISFSHTSAGFGGAFSKARGTKTKTNRKGTRSRRMLPFRNELWFLRELSSKREDRAVTTTGKANGAVDPVTQR